MDEKNAMRCFECKQADLKTGMIEATREIWGWTFIADVPVKTCPSCGDNLMRCADLNAFERAVARALIERGCTSGQALKFMRKAVGISLDEMCNLINKDANWLNGTERYDSMPCPWMPEAFKICAIVMDKLGAPYEKIDLIHTLCQPRQPDSEPVKLVLDRP